MSHKALQKLPYTERIAAAESEMQKNPSDASDIADRSSAHFGTWQAEAR